MVDPYVSHQLVTRHRGRSLSTAGSHPAPNRALRRLLALISAVAMLATALVAGPAAAHDPETPDDSEPEAPAVAEDGAPADDGTPADEDPPADQETPGTTEPEEADGGDGQDGDADQPDQPDQSDQDSGDQPADEPEDGDADQPDDVDEPEDPEPPTPTITEIDEDGNPIVVFPVVGPVNYTDTWGACRGAGCSRGHKGVDIFSLRLTPLVAASDGVISSDRRSAMGISGNTVVITSDDGWRYIYVHLNNDGPGTDDGSNPQAWIIPNRLRVGNRVEAGDVIGYLGDSGNAETTPPHLHFEIHRPGEGAINPTAAVQRAQDQGRVVSVSGLASTAEGRAEHAPNIAAWYRALLGREPTEMELFAWADRFDIGFATTDDLIADLTMAKPRRDAAGTIVRSFEVTLKRLPTLNEIRQWEDAYRNGADLEVITRTLIESGPFKERHGELSDEEFVRVIYRNAVGVEPSDERLEDWLTLFAEGSPRSTLTAYWADSYSVKNSTWHGLEVIQSFRAGLDRMPTADEYTQWVDHLNRGGLIPDVVDAIRTG